MDQLSGALHKRNESPNPTGSKRVKITSDKTAEICRYWSASFHGHRCSLFGSLSTLDTMREIQRQVINSHCTSSLRESCCKFEQISPRVRSHQETVSQNSFCCPPIIVSMNWYGTQETMHLFDFDALSGINSFICWSGASELCHQFPSILKKVCSSILLICMGLNGLQ